MIKINESSNGQSKSTLYKEDTLIIGDSQNGSAHILFSGRGLKPEHVKIFREKGTLWVQNVANDPFVTLNNHPFFKKKAQVGDVIKIRDVELKIEEASENSGAEFKDETKAAAEVKLAEPKIAEKLIEKDDLLKKKELTNLFHVKHQEKNRQAFDDEYHEEEVIHTAFKPQKEISHRPSLKDFDTPSDKDSFDAEAEKKDSAKQEAEKKETQMSWSEHLNVSPFRHVRLFTFLLMGFILIAGMGAVEFYLRASEESQLQELKAAESISDISMALTYAQLSHISPQKHNWSDPEFIQNNLLATLPTGSPSDVKLNCQGEFGNCGYILRVYTSNDLSRFLVAAHPSPSLLQWLIPRSAIIVDSNTMELRRIKDLKPLNRLLASLNTLDGHNVTQISDFVKKGEIISLAELAKAVKKPEFAPPRVLAFLRPGAENLIYNAPRYHPFGGALLKKAEHFSSIHTSSHELAMFQSDLEMLKRLTNLVLYTTDSTEEGKSALAGLRMIAPDKKYILAAIKYDNTGRFRSTQIIMDSEHPDKPLSVVPEAPKALRVVRAAQIKVLPNFVSDDEISMGELPLNTENAVAQEALIEEKDNLENSELAQEESVIEIKPELLLHLENLALERAQSLKKIEKNLNKTVKNYLSTLNKKTLLKRLDKIKAAKDALEEHLKGQLFDLIFETSDTDEAHFQTDHTPHELETWIHNLNLDDLYQEVLDGK